jgi:hypothetical protein
MTQFSDQAEPLYFHTPEPEIDPDPDDAVFDSSPISRMDAPERELVGMALKPRDPADVLLTKTFLAKHGLARLSLHTRQHDQIRCLTTVSPALPDQRGLTRWPLHLAITDKGKRYCSPYEEAQLRYYKPVQGEAAHRAQESNRRDLGVYDDHLSITERGMSLGEGKHSRLSWDDFKKAYRQSVPDFQELPHEGKLPERHCQNPECLKDIGGMHHNVRFHNDACRARAKELRRLDRKGRDDRYRNESDVTADLTNDNSQLETAVTSPHMYREIFPKARPAAMAVSSR